MPSAYRRSRHLVAQVLLDFSKIKRLIWDMRKTRALIVREAALRLARADGSMPKLRPIPGRRPPRRG